MMIQPNSPGSGSYAPMSMVALWGLHGLIAWYLSRDLYMTAFGVGILAVGTVLTQFFSKPQGAQAMVWRPGMMAWNIVICWCLWGALHALWNFDALFAIIWPAIGYIANCSGQSYSGRGRRRAQDIGV
ncbi:hypothetical protein [Rothia sp. P5766]|uniref:hypothetical protein n=1 Tax=Rothia sp. P5766 TaxID=3402656 RepID=UPI003AE8FCE0